MDIKKKTWRNFEVFKCPLIDKSYDEANNSYLHNFYTKTDYKCLVNMIKDNKEPRKYYFEPHPS